MKNKKRSEIASKITMAKLAVVVFVACSTENINLTLANKSGTESKGKKPSTATTLDQDDRESPTIDVAGVNLTGTCYMLGAEGQTADTQAASCTLRTLKSPMEMEFKTSNLSMGSLQTALTAHSHSARHGQFKPASILITPQSPATLNFDVPKKLIKDDLLSTAKLNFENVTIAGRAPVPGMEMSVPMVRLDVENACAGLKTQTIKTEFLYDSKNPTFNSMAVNPGQIRTGKHLSLLHNRIYMTPQQTWSDIAPSVPLEKIKICSASFSNALTMQWSASTPSTTEKKHQLTMDNLLVFSGSQEITQAGDVSEKSRLGWIHDNNYVADKILNMIPHTIIDKKTWCMTGQNSCAFTEGTQNQQSLDLSKITNQSLRLVAKNVLAGTPGSELTMSVYDYVWTPGNSAVNGMSNAGAGGPNSPFADVHLIEMAKVEFTVVYSILP
jgi:hypothetical protein